MGAATTLLPGSHGQRSHEGTGLRATLSVSRTNQSASFVFCDIGLSVSLPGALMVDLFL